MTSSNKSGEEPEGSKRASDFHNSMLGMPGYADDCMFFVVRYLHSVKQQLRECDMDEFEKCYGELNQLWSKAQSQASKGGVPRNEKSQELKQQALKQQALEKIKDWPDLVRDFDRFMTNGRALIRTLGDMPPGK